MISKVNVINNRSVCPHPFSRLKKPSFAVRTATEAGSSLALLAAISRLATLTSPTLIAHGFPFPPAPLGLGLGLEIQVQVWNCVSNSSDHPSIMRGYETPALV